MKISAIDIGSNSVRLAMFADGKLLYKDVQTTRLAEGLAKTGEICPAAAERTAEQVAKFVLRAKSEGAQKIYPFATAAVRSASNGENFCKLVFKKCGAEVDVVSGEREARLGILGALGESDGGIIDVGGASSEVTFQRDGKTIYSKSVNIGTVRLFDVAGRDIVALTRAIEDKLNEYPPFSAKDMRVCNIGGTGTQIAAVKHGLKVYDAKIIDGTLLSRKEIFDMAQNLLSMTVEEVKKVSGMEERRADVIGGGCLLLAKIMERFEIEELTVSESDNLEGYVILKEGRL